MLVGLVFTARHVHSGVGYAAEPGGTTPAEVVRSASPDQLPPRPNLHYGAPLVRSEAFKWEWALLPWTEPKGEKSFQRAENPAVRQCRRSHRSKNHGCSVGPLIQSVRMPRRSFFRWVLPAVLGLLAGFLALAWAVPNEAAAPGWLVSLFSPGLKIAELVMPSTHESLAWTFGWFLRIAIGGNAIFYFAIFALSVYLVDRRRSRSG